MSQAGDSLQPWHISSFWIDLSWKTFIRVSSLSILKSCGEPWKRVKARSRKTEKLMWWKARIKGACLCGWERKMEAGNTNYASRGDTQKQWRIMWLEKWSQMSASGLQNPAPRLGFSCQAYFPCALRYKQKDDVQTRDEGFPRNLVAVGEISHHRTGREEITPRWAGGAGGVEGTASQERRRGVKRKWEKVEETQPVVWEEREVDGRTWEERFGRR